MQGPGHRPQTLPLLGHHHDRRPLFSRQLFEVLAHHNTYKCRGVAFDSRLRPSNNKGQQVFQRDLLLYSPNNIFPLLIFVQHDPVEIVCQSYELT
jgi:hypothetical protein